MVLALAGFVFLACARPAFTPEERRIIEESDSLMYVTVMPVDSAVLLAPSVDFGDAELRSPLLQTLLDKMLFTVQHPSQDGVGIAAPQVGLNRRAVCVQRFDKAGEPFECYVNIRIDSLSGPVVRGPEGCLSVPGLRGIVPRRSVAHISYLRPGCAAPHSCCASRPDSAASRPCCGFCPDSAASYPGCVFRPDSAALHPCCGFCPDSAAYRPCCASSLQGGASRSCCPERVHERVEGFTAVIFQHECDHLDGILYTSRADSLFSAE
ncbi:MAG: peptide deformylase [Bacteroidales bacterium]|nr:peptide deformylase [Bacteroidales bacterium]